MLRHYRWIVAALLCLLAGVQVSSMLGDSQTWDEGIHLAAGYTYLRSGDYSLSPEHPPLGRMLNALPLLGFDLWFDAARMKPPVTEAGSLFVFRNRLSPEVILAVARSMTVLLTLAFAAWVAHWTRRRFGEIAALIALAFFAFDPNVIAHGRYVTTDLIAAFTIFLACTLWFDYLSAPTAGRLVLAGLALGAALSSKYSTVFLIPLLGAAGLLARKWRGTAGMFTVAALFVSLVYAPDLAGIGRDGDWQTHLAGNGFIGAALKWTATALHLPRFGFLIGFDRLLDQNAVGEPGYLLGQISNHGWLSYFPVAFAVKTPVATLAAFLAALIVLPWRRRLAVALAIVPAVFFGICIWSSITIGHRHILPIYAFLFVLTGLGLSRRPRLAAALVALLAIESLAIFPHYLSFFNFAAGGPSKGPEYLLDSNIDWGQDMKRLARMVAERKLDRVCLGYFGNEDPLRYGVEYRPVPRNADEADCVVAASVTALYGLYAKPGEYDWLRRLKPDARAGYSIYLYDLRKSRTPAQALAGLP